MKVDYLVVGAGLTGATIARVLADSGRDVLVVDRRPHVGGNVRDEVHPCGVRYNLYGPHYFRTNSDELWDWVRRFGEFRPWAAHVQTLVDGTPTRWPLCKGYRGHRGMQLHAIDAYNWKMWGAETPDEATARGCFRDDGDDRLKLDKYQGLPVDGYSAWVRKMLERIPFIGNLADWRAWYGNSNTKTVYTGAIDEYYGYCYGELGYRGQKRELVRRAYRQPFQPVVQVNLPSPDCGPIRCIEWNHMAAKPCWDAGSLLTYETPWAPDTPDAQEYPVNTAANKELYKKYRARADADDKLLVCGRLGEYKYMDMDAAIARALLLGRRLLKERP